MRLTGESRTVSKAGPKWLEGTKEKEPDWCGFYCDRGVELAGATM